MARYLVSVQFSVEAPDPDAAWQVGDDIATNMPPPPQENDVTYEGTRVQAE